METVLIESFAPRDSELAALADDARGAAQEMTRRGLHVRHIQTIFVPVDETCFHLFEAGSAEALAEGTRGTHLGSGRVAGVAASVWAADVDTREERTGK
jgi:hypothetical protein